MPAFPQVSISELLIGREAFETTLSPRQNFWNPPVVPDCPTVTCVPGFFFWNSSAMASLIGNTVLEPSTTMTAGAPLSAGGRPQALTARLATATPTSEEQAERSIMHSL